VFYKKRDSELMSITLSNHNHFQNSFIVRFCDKFAVVIAKNLSTP